MLSVIAASTARRRAVGLLGWLATLGADLFPHAGVFAGVIGRGLAVKRLTKLAASAVVLRFILIEITVVAQSFDVLPTPA